MAKVWHYITFAKFPAVARRRRLLPAKWGPNDDMMIEFRAGPKEAGPRDPDPHRCGVIRFGLDAKDPRLLTWPATCKRLRMSKAMRELAESHQRKKDPDFEPSKRFFATCEIPLVELDWETWAYGKCLRYPRGWCMAPDD